MDKLDSRILDVTQNDFPLEQKPYEIMAKKLGIGCDELWGRVEQMMGEGLIRRVGASLDSRKLGYSSTLAAISVKAELIEQASEIIADIPEITHSYLRKDAFNIWFTVIAVDERRIEAILEQIQKALSLDESEILNLPVKKLFKLDARFKS